MNPSILNSVKKVLGIAEDYKAFDEDIIMHINSTFGTLSQLGVGPPDGFFIEDDKARWTDYLGLDKNLNQVKTYIYLKVRLLFDPPATSFAQDSMKKQIEEFEWRINVHQEGRATPWQTPQTTF